jgi:hypothetical protein
MKARKTKRTRARVLRPRYTRSMLKDLLADLKHRTARQAFLAEAITALVTPTGEVKSSEHLFRYGLKASLENHTEGMRRLRHFVDIIAEERTTAAVQS